MEKLNRAQKYSILGPQNLGSRGGPGRWGPLGPLLKKETVITWEYKIGNNANIANCVHL